MQMREIHNITVTTKGKKKKKKKKWTNILYQKQCVSFKLHGLLFHARSPVWHSFWFLFRKKAAGNERVSNPNINNWLLLAYRGGCYCSKRWDRSIIWVKFMCVWVPCESYLVVLQETKPSGRFSRGQSWFARALWLSQILIHLLQLIIFYIATILTAAHSFMSSSTVSLINIQRTCFPAVA